MYNHFAKTDLSSGAILLVRIRNTIMKHAFIALIATTVILSASTATATAQTASEVLGPADVVPLAEQQPPAKIIVDPPLAEPLSRGMVFIEYRAENLRIVPVFGPNVLDVSPRIGHIHVIIDDAPWHWADTSGEPLILVGLSLQTQIINFWINLSSTS
jgi:Family of unknown function (DUF6130)